MHWVADSRARRHLELVLQRLNASGGTPAPGSRLDAWLGFPSRRLAVYGSLAPGRSNHDQLAGLAGTWWRGCVRGTVWTLRRGPDAGYPMLYWHPDGAPVPAWLFRCDDLPRVVAQLDDFEGFAYRRTLVPFDADRGGTVVAMAYTAR